MMQWGKREIPSMQFGSRAEAFDYMLRYALEEKKVSPLEAAKQANEFAEMFAINMGIPLKVEPEKKGVDKYISIAEKIGNYAETHPKAVEAVLGAVTFITGLFVGKKVEQIEAPSMPQQPPINFDEIKD